MTKVMAYVYLLIAIVAEVVGTTALKLSQGFTKPVPTIGVIVGYTIAFFFLSLVLKHIPVGIAYAIWSGIGIVLISLIGVVMFKQILDVYAIAGIVLITIGVLVINLLSKSVPH
jgi:small multidrug resistance pump